MLCQGLNENLAQNKIMFKKLAALKLVWPLGYVTTEYSKGFTTHLKQLRQTKSPSQWIFFNYTSMSNKWLNHDHSIRNVKWILLFAGNNSPSSHQILEIVHLLKFVYDK